MQIVTLKHFKPTWDGEKVFEKNNIEWNEYEDTKDEKIIEQAQITGFPTIMIEKHGNKYQYNEKDQQWYSLN